MNKVIHIKGFLLHNTSKLLTIRIWLYTAFYRFCILFIPMKFLRRFLGEAGVESATEVEEKDIPFIKLISMQINRSSGHTFWKSKCLVKALTAQRLLYKKGIETTLYLGVKKEGNQMIAHAWIRAGLYYVTGGYGKGYSVVGKYKK